MAIRCYADEVQLTGLRPNNHHLPGNVVERQAKQCRLTLVQSKETARDARRSFHAPFLDEHGFRLTCRPAGVYQYCRTIVVPLF